MKSFHLKSDVSEKGKIYFAIVLIQALYYMTINGIFE